MLKCGVVLLCVFRRLGATYCPNFKSTALQKKFCLKCVTLEDEDIRFLRKTENNSTSNTASHRRRPESYLHFSDNCKARSRSVTSNVIMLFNTKLFDMVMKPPNAYQHLR